ncbi:MAG: hypothetical protein EOO03_07020, partial [Chitinophagaceae bacterium]
MRNSFVLPAIAAMAFVCMCCNGNEKKQTGSNEDSQPTTTVSAKEEQQPNKFDINSIPVSDKELGQFPFFSLPAGVQEQNKAVVKSFDKMLYWDYSKTTTLQL